MTKIPKNIFQIYHDKNLIKENVKNDIININPDYNYKIYDFDEGIEFVKSNFDFDKQLCSKIIDYIKNLVRPAHKSDLLRYCLLYIYGGVYLDVDLKQKNSLDYIINMTDNSDFISSFGLLGNLTRMPQIEFDENNKKYHSVISNGFLFSIAKNPILLDLIKKIITISYNSRHPVNIYYFHEYLSKEYKDSLLSYNKMLIKDINVYLFKEQTFERGGKNAFINNKNEIIMYSNNFMKKTDYLK
jgi:hypothetical protein